MFTFNSFGNSMNAILLQVIKLTARYIEIWNMSNTDALTSNGNINWLDIGFTNTIVKGLAE